jgi:hypothetical protein
VIRGLNGSPRRGGRGVARGGAVSTPQS